MCLCQTPSVPVHSSASPPLPSPPGLWCLWCLWCTDHLSPGVSEFSCGPPIPLICGPSDHPHSSVSSCSLAPCSLPHLCLILSAFLQSPPPCFSTSLHSLFFWLLLSPSFSSLPPHMETHKLLAEPSISQRDLAGTCQRQHHPACLHQTAPCLLLLDKGLLSRGNIAGRLPFLVNLRMHDCLEKKKKKKLARVLTHIYMHTPTISW